MKTREELNALKEEVENLNKKLAELTEDELKQVVGGAGTNFNIDDQSGGKEFNIYKNTTNKDFEPGFPSKADN